MIYDCPAGVTRNEAEVCEKTDFPKSEIWEFRQDNTNRLIFMGWTDDPGDKDQYENYQGNL